MELHLPPMPGGPGRLSALPPADPVVDRGEPRHGAWFLFNASPDVHAQIESCPALHPSRGPGGERERCQPRAVLLTDAELDHTLGLLLLREGRALEIHATAGTGNDALQDGTSLLRTLSAYCLV